MHHGHIRKEKVNTSDILLENNNFAFKKDFAHFQEERCGLSEEQRKNLKSQEDSVALGVIAKLGLASCSLFS